MSVRRMRRVLLAIGIAMSVSPLVAGVAAAQTAGDAAAVGFFDVSAESTGIGAAMGNPSAQPNPVAAGLVPNAVAQLGAGPSGRAVASMAWPGPLLANAGSLANVIGTPLPPEVVANANYPVKAEANAGAGARDEDTVGPMSAVVDGAESAARAAISDFAAPGLVSAARVVTRSRSFLEAGSPVAVAETVLTGVEVAGLVKIETIRTIARGRTDGQEATTEQETIVSGVTVQGQGATIDGSGIHFGSQDAPNPVTPVAEGAAPALEGMSMQVKVTEPLERRGEGGSAAVRTGSVIFDWALGESGQHITVVLGGASVTVAATPGAALDGGGFDIATGAATTPSFDGGSPSFDTGSLIPSGSLVAGGTTPTGAAAPSVGGGSSSIESPLDLTLAGSVSDRVPMGWMIVGALGMIIAGLSLHGLREQALAATLAGGAACPLERGPA